MLTSRGRRGDGGDCRSGRSRRSRARVGLLRSRVGCRPIPRAGSGGSARSCRWSAAAWAGLLDGGAGGVAGGLPLPLVAGAVVGDDSFAADPMGGEPGNSAVPERGGGRCLLVVEDLGVDEPAAVIERGVDVAVASSGPAVMSGVAATVELPAAAVRDGSDLLDVDVDQLTWLFPLVAHDRLAAGPVTAVQAAAAGGVEDRLHRRRGELDVVGDAVGAPTTCPSQVQHPTTDPGAVRFGERFGRDDRSKRPASPSARNRSRHLRTVLASTWNRSAVASIVQPASSTSATIRRRPSGVNGAFGCWLLA